MALNKKKFDACLLRIGDDELIVAEWNQLVTTVDKSKLTIGSSVGVKRSTNKRDKVIRGTIIVVGPLRVCQQQMKLFMGKINKKKMQENQFDDDNDEEELRNVVDNNDSLHSDDEKMSESDDECLHIDTQEDICGDTVSKSTQIKELKIVEKGNKIQTNQSDEVAHLGKDKTEQTNNLTSSKRGVSDLELESPKSKRSIVSLARFDEMKNENIRLKKQLEIYKKEWMPRPTDPGAIRYLIRMGGILSDTGEDGVEKGEKLDLVCTRLDMTEEQLKQLQKANGTKTARAIIRALYPPSTRVNVKPEDIEPDSRAAIQDYVQMFHGMEDLTQGQINESINNVFRSAKSQIKGKNVKLRDKQEPEQQIIGKLKKINNKNTYISNGKENFASDN